MPVMHPNLWDEWMDGWKMCKLGAVDLVLSVSQCVPEDVKKHKDADFTQSRFE